ncbi:MAG: hypothetical protein AAFU73_00220 [Planctomycetota bacterium]
MIGALGRAKALWPAGALATASIAVNDGWDGLVAVVRDAGVGAALLYVALRFEAPWVAQTLEGQQRRTQKAEDAAEARVEQLEREAHDLRAQVLEVGREAARLEAQERAHAAEFEVRAQRLELEHVEVTRFEKGMEAQQRVVEDLQRQLAILILTAITRES